jgi:hypothetical protein
MKEVTPDMSKKNLLFAVIGRDEFYKTWFAENNNQQSYDIFLIVYNDLKIDPELFCRTELCVHAPGYKFQLIKTYVERYLDLFENYEYFFFPDDDIEICPESINAIFEEMNNCKIDICQPALLPTDMRYIWGPALHRRNDMILHESKLVELMMPFMSRKFLDYSIRFFGENKSAQGVDIVWSKWAAKKGIEMYVFDKYPARHCTQLGGPQNDLYSSLAKEGINAHRECADVMQKHGAKEYWDMLLRTIARKRNRQ